MYIHKRKNNVLRKARLKAHISFNKFGLINDSRNFENLLARLRTQSQLMNTSHSPYLKNNLVTSCNLFPNFFLFVWKCVDLGIGGRIQE